MKIDSSQPSAAPAPLDPAHAKLKKVTEQFESYFLHQMLVEMRKSIPKDTETPDDAHQEETFRDMMDQNLADTMAQRGDLGIGKLMYDQLDKTIGDSPEAKTETDR